MRKFVCIVLASLMALSSIARSYSSDIVRIETPGWKMKMMVLQPKEASGPVPGILWIHGGGYVNGGL